ncbi:hypothetical protein C1645_823497 [Glomus cerebriforme]|uniref:Uncharacterized protein n=1 Tax=Glomus cerebriforme TaxID=658196 RepID=A0A397SXH3_9GLOM|nr:hypothetical protein C1645_823497 [Glomus cerebriforme]
MSEFRIPSHLILTPKQKEQLCSLTVSEFTDIKWESQIRAVSFLKKHGILPVETRQDFKWQTRYSNIPKGIRLLQCCCGTDRTLTSKNIRKSRQNYEFVGCLAFARIKNNRDKHISVFGYLRHSKKCQYQRQISSLHKKFVEINGRNTKECEKYERDTQEEINEKYKKNFENFEKEFEEWRKSEEELKKIRQRTEKTRN